MPLESRCRITPISSLAKQHLVFAVGAIPLGPKRKCKVAARWIKRIQVDKLSRFQEHCLAVHTIYIVYVFRNRRIMVEHIDIAVHAEINFNFRVAIPIREIFWIIIRKVIMETIVFRNNRHIVARKPFPIDRKFRQLKRILRFQCREFELRNCRIILHVHKIHSIARRDRIKCKGAVLGNRRAQMRSRNAHITRSRPGDFSAYSLMRANTNRILPYRRKSIATQTGQPFRFRIETRRTFRRDPWNRT